MDLSLIVGGILAAGASGIGLGVGARLVPLGLRAGRDLHHYHHSPEAHRQRRVAQLERSEYRLSDPPGRRRDSSIVGLYEDTLRRKDGSYTRLYDFPLPTTFNAHEGVNESVCDEIGRMVAVPKPPGTVMQFRYAVAPDPGRAIAAHLRARSYDRIYLPACRLHDNNVDFYKALADAGAFRIENASFNITVPVHLPDDDTSRGLSAFVPAVLREVRARGIKNFSHAARQAHTETCDDGVVRRLFDDEQKAYEKAEKVFRFVEMQSPVPLRRLDRAELWTAVYQSHCLNAPSTPHLSDVPGLDVRDYLCGETVESGGWYMLHGSTPVAMVSMMRPGDALFATSMRALTAHPALTFRHTLVAEFIYLDQRQAIKQLDRRMRSVKRTNNRADGRKHMSPEAKASLDDLEAVRAHVAGSPEALVQMRFFALVYGEPARTRSELKSSLNTLDYNCEQLITAMQTIDGVEAAIEEPAALRSLYPRTMVGCADGKSTGREFMEIANSLAAVAPVESAWRGSARPHTLFSTTTGRLTGISLFDKRIASLKILLS